MNLSAILEIIALSYALEESVIHKAKLSEIFLQMHGECNYFQKLHKNHVINN